MGTEADPVLLRAYGRVGSVLRGKWRLDRLLGVGGMASVYLGTHRNGARGAVKILHPELALDRGIRARFLKEGYAANLVGHPGAVAVLDDDEADGSVFLVMELLEGESLEARAERSGGRLAIDEVLSTMDQVLDVLTAAHAKGIVHRDLKPENLFLTTTGQLKVLDFGIARVRADAGSSGMTVAGMSMGTPSFMPPEQARGEWNEVDARTDIWAIGATMYALLLGRPVHEAATVNLVLMHAMTRSAPKVADGMPECPIAVAALVDRALAFDKEGRWPNAPTMQDALRAAYYGHRGSPITTAPKMTVPPLAEDEEETRVASVMGTTARAVLAAAESAAPIATTPTIATKSTTVVTLAALAVGLAIGVIALALSSRTRTAPSTAQLSPTPATSSVVATEATTLAFADASAAPSASASSSPPEAATVAPSATVDPPTKASVQKSAPSIKGTPPPPAKSVGTPPRPKRGGPMVNNL